MALTLNTLYSPRDVIPKEHSIGETIYVLKNNVWLNKDDYTEASVQEIPLSFLIRGLKDTAVN